MKIYRNISKKNTPNKNDRFFFTVSFFLRKNHTVHKKTSFFTVRPMATRPLKNCQGAPSRPHHTRQDGLKTLPSPRPRQDRPKTAPRPLQDRPKGPETAQERPRVPRIVEERSGAPNSGRRFLTKRDLRCKTQAFGNICARPRICKTPRPTSA